MNAIERLAELTGTSAGDLRVLDQLMSARTHRQNVPEAFLAEMDARLARAAKDLSEENIGANSRDKLMDTVLVHEEQLRRILTAEPGADEFEKIVRLARRIARVGRGFFLKKEKAMEILETRPPENVLKFLNCGDVSEMLARHEVAEIFSALRFMETDEWMHKTFSVAYGRIQPEDFEERDIQIAVLGPAWSEVAKQFVAKKHHNVSHLKELGVIFLNPIAEDAPGKLLRDFALLGHYFHEIDFYARLFRRHAQGADFAHNLSALLRGDLPSAQDADPGDWLIIQRYLAKFAPEDRRLFLPRVNPESLHWRRAERDLAEFAVKLPDWRVDFWQDLDWPGVPSDEGIISLDLEDNAMAAVSRAEGRVQYFNYHQQEAIWNRLFEMYAGGEEALEAALIQSFLGGVIRLPG